MKRGLIAVFALLTVLALAGCNANGTSSSSTSNESSSDSTALAAQTPDDVLAEIEADYTATAEELTKQANEAVTACGDTYDSYLENKQAITDWYAAEQSESAALFERTKADSQAYFELVVAQVDHSDTDALEDSLKNYYRAIEDAEKEYYRSVYTDAYRIVYDGTYDGLVKDGYDATSYNEWNEVATNCYREWSDASTAAYRQYSDAQSELYDIYSDMTTKFYNKDFEIAEVFE